MILYITSKLIVAPTGENPVPYKPSLYAESFSISIERAANFYGHFLTLYAHVLLRSLTGLLFRLRLRLLRIKSVNECEWDLTEWIGRLTANAVVTTVLWSIHHPPTQWNLRGGRDEAVLNIVENPKSPFKNWNQNSGEKTQLIRTDCLRRFNTSFITFRCTASTSTDIQYTGTAWIAVFGHNFIIYLIRPASKGSPTALEPAFHTLILFEKTSWA